jgi:DNA-binding CsgD family transcriptional regulator
MSRVVGREALLAEVRDSLERGESVALNGPVGVGKSALLTSIEEQRRATHDDAVLHARGAHEEHALPFAALRDLLAQCPPELVDELPVAVREPVAAGLVGIDATDELRSDLAAGFHSLLSAWSETRPVLMLLDDVQWLDGESSAIVGYARRRLRGRVALVATIGPGDNNEEIDVSGLHHLEVPPLPAAEMIDLLCEHGLSADIAQRVYVESGGIPSLALALCGAIGERPSVLGAPTPLPSSIARVLRDRFLAQPEEVRATLSQAALLHHPTVRQLERGGRLAAEEHVGRAAQSGLVCRAEGAIRFTPSALRQIIAELMPVDDRIALHAALADVAGTSAERLRHLALARPGVDADLARELGVAARDSAAAGAREIAAELYLLAADRSPYDLCEQRVEWLAAAVETAAPGNHVDLVVRALGDFLDATPTPAQSVRVRLAIPELAGYAVAALDEVMTAALADAGDDDLLVAKVLLQRARIALMESRPDLAERSSQRAVDLLERGDDCAELALGLTTLAVARRWLGGDHTACLDRALDLQGPTPTGFLHTSPEYMAARFAFYDDRLEEAWSGFSAMLSHVERGAGMDHVHVLRCLVEVGVRSGRCREAMQYAARASRVGEEFDLDAHTSWFITALAELAGGDLARARTLASHGAAAAEERGDTRYWQRHLVLLGQAQLRSGDAQGASEALGRVRAYEREHDFGDPTVNRWHVDLVTALVVLGRLDDAGEVLAEARRQVADRNGTDGVAAQLDRAEAQLLMSRCDLDHAEALLERSAKAAAELGMRIDVGRALVARAHVERRRRRAAAARATLQEALELFEHLHADAWATQVRSELMPDKAGSGADPLLDRLTDAEARVAREVAQGASNREIAERTYVSVKTVEATLTRIYRKLDVRSRTHLAALLVPAPPE